MPKKPTTSAAKDIAAIRAATRNTDSAPAQPVDPAAAKGDPPATRALQTQGLAAELPFNANKAQEHGEANALDTPVGKTATADPGLAAASTLSERMGSAKTGRPPKAGTSGPGGDLERVRSDGGGQRLTTNQGVPVADNQNSLKAGARGPVLLEDFILREKITHFDHERIPERIVHARGSGAHGYFECTDAAIDLTRAAPFAEVGKRTPVFVRFSTVAGERGSKDTARDVRGFAVKFYTDEGNWDLVGNNMPVFFIQDAMKFPDLIHAVKPEPHHGMPQAASAHDTFWDFISLMPESTHMMMWAMSDRAIPRSLRMMQGFGVHTFRLVNALGETRFVKFHWQPKLGTHSLVWDEAVKISGADPDFHRRDLWEAIEAGEYPEWELGLQVFTQEEADSFSFDILDPTKIVPEEVAPIRIVGRMVLDRNPDNFFAETEQVAFCAAHVIPGIDFTNDPLLAGRIHSYVDTQISRLGGPNFHELPINAPLAPVHNNQRDGMHRQAIHRGRVAYEPNSLGGGCPFQAGAAQGFMSVKARMDAESDSDKVRVKPEKFADHYTQARLFYESQSPVEQAHMAAAFRFELSKVTVPAVRARMVASLRNVSDALAEKVAQGLGMELPEPMPSAIKSPPRPEVAESPSLSLMARPGEGGIRTRKVALLVADGVEGPSLRALVDALMQQGAVPRLVGPHLGAFATSEGDKIEADATLENNPGFLFDALVLPDGEAAVKALSEMGQTMEFVKDQYRHCKTILAIGAGQGLLSQAEVPMTLPDGGADPGLILADPKSIKSGIAAFTDAMGRHRHYERDSDPPRV